MSCLLLVPAAFAPTHPPPAAACGCLRVCVRLSWGCCSTRACMHAHTLQLLWVLCSYFSLCCLSSWLWLEGDLFSLLLPLCVSLCRCFSRAKCRVTPPYVAARCRALLRATLCTYHLGTRHPPHPPSFGLFPSRSTRRHPSACLQLRRGTVYIKPTHPLIIKTCTYIHLHIVSLDRIMSVFSACCLVCVRRVGHTQECSARVDVSVVRCWRGPTLKCKCCDTAAQSRFNGTV